MGNSDEILKIKSLRERTGLSFGEIKKAITSAHGNVEKAEDILRSLGSKIAKKRSDRAIKEGVVAAYIHNTKKVGALVELGCETDFVARNEEFRGLAQNLAMHITAMKPETAEELLKQAFIKEPEKTISDLVSSAIAKLGENIRIGRFSMFEVK